MYHPGETNFRSADVILINKVDTAQERNIQLIEKNAKLHNPNAHLLKTESPSTADDPDRVRNKKVLVIEDGPTITHGSMSFGAGMVVAKDLNAIVVDPKPYLLGSIKTAFETYSQLDLALPALGYSEKQLNELEQIINSVDCDLVLSATPIDITRILKVNKPLVHVTYKLKETNGSPLAELILKTVAK